MSCTARAHRSPEWPKGQRPRAREVVAAVCCLLVLTAGCSHDASGSAAPVVADPAGPQTGAAPDGTGHAISFTVVGDSITAGLAGPVRGTEVPESGSWLGTADVYPLQFRGGYAVPGATTLDMESGVHPVDADVLVVMAGTNDVGTQVPWEETRDNLLTITGTVGPDTVLLVAVPPHDGIPRLTAELNGQLTALAAEQGWAHLDPWDGAATEEGTYSAGSSDDGVHPTQAVADLVGDRIRAALVELAAQ